MGGSKCMSRVNSVGIIDYGVGNVGSIRNMFRRIGILARILSDPAELMSVDRAVLPGVGSFSTAMALLCQSDWDRSIKDFAVSQARPLLGVCLGMQLLGNSSEEGHCAGLSIIDSDVRFFDRARMSKLYPVPHMGWSVVRPNLGAALFRNLPEDPRFYFVHSLHMTANGDEPFVAAQTNYGYDFCCSVQQGNIFGVQFHPEKSHVYGMTLLSNFSSVSC